MPSMDVIDHLASTMRMRCPQSSKWKLKAVSSIGKQTLNIVIIELSDALKSCLDIAAGDESLTQMCYESVFSADYFWD